MALYFIPLQQCMCVLPVLSMDRQCLLCPRIRSPAITWLQTDRLGTCSLEHELSLLGSGWGLTESGLTLELEIWVSAGRTHMNKYCCFLLNKNSSFCSQTFSKALFSALWEIRWFFAPGSFSPAGGGKTHGFPAECGKFFNGSCRNLEGRRDELWLAASQAYLWCLDLEENHFFFCLVPTTVWVFSKET